MVRFLRIIAQFRADFPELFVSLQSHPSADAKINATSVKSLAIARIKGVSPVRVSWFRFTFGHFKNRGITRHAL